MNAYMREIRNIRYISEQSHERKGYPYLGSWDHLTKKVLIEVR